MRREKFNDGIPFSDPSTNVHSEYPDPPVPIRAIITLSIVLL